MSGRADSDKAEDMRTAAMPHAAKMVRVLRACPPPLRLEALALVCKLLIERGETLDD